MISTKNILICLAVAATYTTASANPVMRSFSGGDPGEGLNLQGTFVYAVDMGGGATGGLGGQTIGDATFTPEQSTPGAAIFAPNEDSAIVEFGASPNDDQLEGLVAFGRWAGGTDNITIDLDVTPGQAYVLQLMFVEGWNASAPGIRQFNVDVEGVNVATNFDITEITGPQALNRAANPAVLTPNALGAVLEYMFTAPDGTANIVVSHGAIDNPRVEAFTLRVVPEPSSLATMTLLLLTAGCAMRRRR